MIVQYKMAADATAVNARETEKRRFVLLMAALSSILLLSLWAAACLGVVPIAPAEVGRILYSKIIPFNSITSQLPLAAVDIVWELRLPRALLAATAGAGLALCGTVMQASVQNPLAEPYILGVSAGASMGAAFAILSGSAQSLFGMGIAFWAFGGAMAAAVLVLALSVSGGPMSTVKIVLSGIAVNALFTGLTNIIIYLSGNVDGVRTVTFWTMGSMAAANWENIILPITGVVICALYFALQPRMLNILLLGEETAVTLGIDLNQVRKRNMLVTSLLTAVIVSACGVFAFVGLIIPHIVRGMVGADHRRLVPAIVLGGAIFLLWAEILARIILPGGELPIGIITALIGAPFFMYILRKRTYGFGNN